MSTKVIVINRDKLFVKGLKYSLEQDNYFVDAAYSIKEAVENKRRIMV